MEDFFWDEFTIRKNEIEGVLRKHWILIDYYYINEDGSIDVEGNVKFSENMDFLKELPLKFNKVSGDFDCSKLSLESLKGSPIEVGGTFNCSFNPLVSLEYLPKKAGCFIFDNAIKTIYTGNVNCYFNEVKLLYLTDITNMRLPDIITENVIFLKVVFKYQQYYAIWNSDRSLNEKAFDTLIKEIDEGLE